MRFRDRVDAGRRLAARLGHLRFEHPVVVGLPRGGVPVAFEVARALGAPLDVILVRKLGVPSQPELAMGAIGEGGVRVLNDRVVRYARISDEQIARIEAAEAAELERRAGDLRGTRHPVPFAGRTVVIVDDGLATGSTARAAIQIAREKGAKRVVLAAPVAPPETIAALETEADEVVAIVVPDNFRGVGQFYDDFSQTPDAEVVELLERARSADGSTAGPELGATPDGAVDAEVVIHADHTRLPGHLTVPAGARGIVLFAHGSGSGRSSPRNQAVARHLNRAGLATLLFDLLDRREATDRNNVFDVPLLGSRLVAATQWVTQQQTTRLLPIGYFGASTGAGAALWAAAIDGNPVRAIVSRGGRPDLAFDRLGWVRAPTLLIVGGNDDVVLELNRDASRRLVCERQLVVVPGAGHLFEEPGALRTVAGLAADWFVEHLAAPPPPANHTE